MKIKLAYFAKVLNNLYDYCNLLLLRSSKKKRIFFEISQRFFDVTYYSREFSSRENIVKYILFCFWEKVREVLRY